MARANDVFSIIPTVTDAAVIGVGQPVSALTLNQVGVFDYETGLSINVAGAATTREFFIAMAVDRDGDGVIDDIIKSAGNAIQKRNITSYTARCGTLGRPQILDIQGFKANCETEYGIKVEFNNDQKYRQMGFNQLVKTFMVKTGCCEKCATCPTGNCSELVNLLIKDVNNDEDGLVIASAAMQIATLSVSVAPTATGDVTFNILGTDIVVSLLAADTAATAGDKIADAINADGTLAFAISNGAGVVTMYALTTDVTESLVLTTYTDTDTTNMTMAIGAWTVTNVDAATFDALLTANPTFSACPALRLTSVPDALKNYCNVNLQYFKIRGVKMIASLIEGFSCNGVVNETQTIVYEEGRGYDYKELEYYAGGNQGNPGPYRVGELTGTAFEISTLVVKGTIYNAVHLNYDQDTMSGWLEYKNDLSTTILFPCGNDTAAASLIAIIDALAPNFDPKANDLAACTECDDVNLTQDKAANVDGLG